MTASASPSLLPGTVNSAYCGAADAPIPGAAQALASGKSSDPGASPVQEAWFAMGATMVPACSEVTADPPAVTVKNFTGGRLSDAELQTWVKEFQEFWTLFEWGQEHGQANFLEFLLGGASDNAVTFVRDGGKIVTTPACEYAEKVNALSVASGQMRALTNGTITQTGIAYVDGSEGPCSSTWISSSGTRATHSITAGTTGWEVDITSGQSNAALGRFLELPDSWPEGTSGAADALISEAIGLS